MRIDVSFAVSSNSLKQNEQAVSSGDLTQLNEKNQISFKERFLFKSSEAWQ